MNLKKTNLYIALIIAGLFSLSFIVVQPIANVHLVGWLFVMVAVALVWLTFSNLIENFKSYAWASALPRVAWQHMLITAAIATAFIIANLVTANAHSGAFLRWLIAVELAVLGINAARLLLMKAAVPVIETREAEVKAKVNYIKGIQADASLLAQKAEGDAKTLLAKLAEKCRFSDPMSHDSLAPIEQEIAANLAAMKADASKIPALVKETENLLNERNLKCKLLK
jgi:hypothetical protein